MDSLSCDMPQRYHAEDATGHEGVITALSHTEELSLPVVLGEYETH